MDDENVPLPTLEEVLICDSTTTAEEVFCVCWGGIGGTILDTIIQVNFVHKIFVLEFLCNNIFINIKCTVIIFAV